MMMLKNTPRLSLAAVLTIAFLSLSILMLMIAGGLQLFSGIQVQQMLIASEQQVIAQEAARSVSKFIQEKYDNLETTIWVSSPVRMSREEQKLLLDSLLGLHPAFWKLALLDADDRVLVQSARLSLALPWLFDDQFRREGLAAVRRKKRYISKVYLDPVTREPLVTLAVPVTDALRDFRGSLVTEVNLMFMWDLVAQLKVRETGVAYVVNRQGDLIAFGDSTRVLRGENVSFIKPVDEFMRSPADAHPAGVTSYRGIMGDTVVGTFAALGIPDWAVVTEVPWGNAYREVIRQAFVSIAITSAMALLACIVGVYVARRLAVPLVTLTETAMHIAEGRRESPARVSGPREVTQLAKAFNSMTAQVRQSLEGLEQRVAERTTELETANKELEAFSYSIAHDLRAPLRAIDGFTRILVEDHLPAGDARARHVADVVRKETRRMALLIDGLLAFSRLSRVAIQPAPIDMNALAASVYDELASPRDRRRIDFHVDALPRALGDPVLIRQVLVNLVSNAIKFSSKKERACIEIGGREAEHEAVYFVRDNGLGFDMHYAGKLFGVFERLHSEQEIEGTGVGLAIVQRVITRHGGRVWAEGLVDRGATFYFSLPRA